MKRLWGNSHPEPQLITPDVCVNGVSKLVYFPELGWQSAWFNEHDNTNNAGGWALGYDYYGLPPTHWLPLPHNPQSLLPIKKPG